MNNGESLYKRIALGVNYRSSDIACSFIEGRVDAKEKFEKDGKIFSFEQTVQQHSYAL